MAIVTGSGSDLSGKVALVTGASRGIGAHTARILGSRGARVVVNYRDKAKRADKVVDEITASGTEAIAVRADLTDPVAVQAMFSRVRHVFGRVDLLVLNASGGMERGVDPGYALRLNRDAQLQVLECARPLMPAESRVVFVTSHQAHFHGSKPGIDRYEPVAHSKRSGEDALRERIPELSGHGISLVVVSGDMIEGTITVTLLDRANPGTVEARRRQAGELPTIAEFATGIAVAATAWVDTGHTVYVGGTDYLTAGG
ncbi:SDR family oxidoreductase [Saccharopolyspora spinosa]|uniref:NAD(P)-dependent dehydrogenase (Short-subunit alcohol dehydrogenase family) n=1 Tax=Saccharopolyspora spinosa TaxID=60894 RepID=A0A2N3Y311_SACSN|nr:SDR family oxidoreductase [Saccharopolyspora spinosa]PKW17298.1 NAD(P)-dependent dehydrogenase (short-subunit alcohol dehydrogenase family) [Saccharopolyspora spinosa]